MWYRTVDTYLQCIYVGAGTHWIKKIFLLGGCLDVASVCKDVTELFTVQCTIDDPPTQFCPSEVSNCVGGVETALAEEPGARPRGMR